MGLWSWLMSLGEPTPRSRDRIHQKDLERQAKGKAAMTRQSRQPRPQVASTQPSSSPDETEVSQPEIIPTTQAGLAAAGMARTHAELEAIYNATHSRMQQDHPQHRMSQDQMNAMIHAVQQEAAFFHGVNEPLQGVLGQPYWKTYYGELGRNLGPFVPQRGGK